MFLFFYFWSPILRFLLTFEVINVDLLFRFFFLSQNRSFSFSSTTTDCNLDSQFTPLLDRNNNNNNGSILAQPCRSRPSTQSRPFCLSPSSRLCPLEVMTGSTRSMETVPHKSTETKRLQGIWVRIYHWSRDPRTNPVLVFQRKSMHSLLWRWWTLVYRISTSSRIQWINSVQRIARKPRAMNRFHIF